MIHSRDVNVTPSKNDWASFTLIRVKSAMLFSPTVTASASGRSRAPLHLGQGTWLMNSSIFSRRYSESVSA